ncbi:MAG: hypothetical protein M9958_00530 [Chitinophagales bacterium]|nr:hypothetical protein [Chitinophagales bacterium]
MWYSIDFNRLIKMLLPSILQQAKHYSWLRAQLFPLIEIHEDFKDFRLKFNRELRYNGQVIILENLLNNEFDIDNRGIVVKTNPSGMSQVFVFQNEETEPPVNIYQKQEGQPIYIFQKSEELERFFDFEVIVPVGILTPGEERQLKSLTLRYKLDGKRPRFIYQNDQIF